jgi:ADP-ribose pyrophosphatase YjhB (NUDIX family)
MEEQETPVQGAMREAWEEAMAKIEIDRLLAVYSVPRISQVQLIFRAQLASTDFAPGTESLETKLDSVGRTCLPKCALGAEAQS